MFNSHLNWLSVFVIPALSFSWRFFEKVELVLGYFLKSNFLTSNRHSFRHTNVPNYIIISFWHSISWCHFPNKLFLCHTIFLNIVFLKKLRDLTVGRQTTYIENSQNPLIIFELGSFWFSHPEILEKEKSRMYVNRLEFSKIISYFSMNNWVEQMSFQLNKFISRRIVSIYVVNVFE